MAGERAGRVGYNNAATPVMSNGRHELHDRTAASAGLSFLSQVHVAPAPYMQQLVLGMRQRPPCKNEAELLCHDIPVEYVLAGQG